MASFESINYLLRPNKNVERKLLLEMYRALRRGFPLSEYRYVGMGSLWFADFIPAHREIQMEDMISIERHSADRAEFNRPFNCVVVEEGNSTDVLQRLALDSKPILAWLDHDSALGGPALEDASILATHAPVGSVLIVSVNASPLQLRERDPDSDRIRDKVDVFRDYAGRFAPEPVTEEKLTPSQLGATICDTLLAAFEHGVRATRRGRRFHQLARIAYADGTEMVTVGGMVTDEETEAILADLSLEKLAFYPPEPVPFSIDVPQLTIREKHALDRFLPGGTPLKAREVRRKIKVQFKQKHLDAYAQFYRYYPLFGEYDA